MKQKLDRTLGLYSSLTISIGTMIGSAIFVLAGTSFKVAGPSSSLAIFLSGLAALFTAFSFAELVTFIPTAGGGYAYVRDATNNGILGFICGWGFWLGYAMSCSLFALGFGTFLNYFIPAIPQMLGAYILIFYVLISNIKGVKGSSRMQNIITTGLILLLIFYIVYGVFFLDMSNQRPFFTDGMKGTLKAMGLLYMTYIGYGLITTVSEEVINPEKTIPKAIMISLAAVMFIKTAVFFVGSSVKNWSQLVPEVTSTPMIDTAIVMGGKIGGYLFALAGILATLSSINTAILASSRTSFALSRDRKLPSLFKSINKNTKTPIFSIISTGIIVLITTAIKNLQHISSVTSVFALTGYSLVNLAVIIFRRSKPDLKRTFKVPFYPLTPILGIIINILMILELLIGDVDALIFVVATIIVGVLYYYFGLPKLNKASKLITPQSVPTLNSKDLGNEKEDEMFKVIVPIGNIDNVYGLVKIAQSIAMKDQGKVVPIHVVEVAEAIPLNSSYDYFKKNMIEYENILKKLNKTCTCKTKCSEPLLFLSRNRAHSINTATREEKANFTLIGWHRSGLASKMLGGLVPEILRHNESTVGILNVKGEGNVKKILYPYGGGTYSKAAANTIKRLAKSYGAEVTLLRIIEEEISDKEYNEIREIMNESLKVLNVKGEVLIVNNPNVKETIIEMSSNYDLIVLGIGSEWGLGKNIAGSSVDIISEKAKCSVLVVRGFHKALQKTKIRKIFNRLKEI